MASTSSLPNAWGHCSDASSVASRRRSSPRQTGGRSLKHAAAAQEAEEEEEGERAWACCGRGGERGGRRLRPLSRQKKAAL